MVMHNFVFVFSPQQSCVRFVSFYAERGTEEKKRLSLLRSVGGLFIFRRRAPFFVCSAKERSSEDKKRRRRVVGVLVLVSAVSSVARAFPRRVFRVFVVVALSLSKMSFQNCV